MNTDPMQTLSGLIEQSLNRIKEATIGVLDITDDKLRGHLRQLINNELGNENCFLADPVVEQTFGWESADCTFADLAEQTCFLQNLPMCWPKPTIMISPKLPALTSTNCKHGGIFWPIHPSLPSLPAVRVLAKPNAS